VVDLFESLKDQFRELQFVPLTTLEVDHVYSTRAEE